MPVNLIQYRREIGVFNCTKCGCTNSSKLFPHKLFPKFNLLSLLDLVLTNSILLSLLLFWLKYLFDIILQSDCPYRTANALNIPYINVKHQIFKNLYFQSTIIEWNKLGSNIRNSETLIIFKSKIVKFMRPTANSIFGCHSPVGVKLLTRLRRLNLNLCCLVRFSSIHIFKIKPPIITKVSRG